MRDIAKALIACIDLTNLSTSCTSVDIELLCQQAVTPHGPVAAVCVFPQWVELAKAELANSRVKVATVVNFPAPRLTIDACVQAIEENLASGADEIDVVMPYDVLAQGGDARVAKMLAACRQACGQNVLKVIIESGELSSPELIARASELVLAAGADFVKTSTGKTEVGATIQAAEAILRVLQAAKRPAGIKLSGGIRTFVTAYEYVQLAERYLGERWQDPQYFRIGASQLLQALLDQTDRPL